MEQESEVEQEHKEKELVIQSRKGKGPTTMKFGTLARKSTPAVVVATAHGVKLSATPLTDQREVNVAQGKAVEDDAISMEGVEEKPATDKDETSQEEKPESTEMMTMMMDMMRQQTERFEAAAQASAAATAVLLERIAALEKGKS